jgi:hypothetical protein
MWNFMKMLIGDRVLVAYGLQHVRLHVRGEAHGHVFANLIANASKSLITNN